MSTNDDDGVIRSVTEWAVEEDGDEESTKLMTMATDDGGAASGNE